MRGRGNHSSERQLGSHSSRTDHEVTTYDADVDHIDFGDEEESKIEDALTTQVTDHATVRSKRTAAKYSVSADEFILARETGVRFVRYSIAEAVGRQKKNTDKNGRANVLSFNEGDLVLLSTVNLPRHIVTNVGSNKLLPKFSSVHLVCCAA